MEIILSKNVRRLTGTLSKKHGYFIRQTPEGKYVGVRKPGLIPADGHLRFIFDLADIADSGLLVTDILVGEKELREALEEAGYRINPEGFPPNSVFTHKMILKLKEYLNR